MSRVRRLFGFLVVVSVVTVLAGGVLPWLMRPRLPKQFVLELALAGPLRETPGAASLGLLQAERLSLIEVAHGLRHAAGDDRVKAVLVRVSSVQTGWAATRELRRALAEVRRAGRPVIALLETGGDKEYAVASAADSLLLIPAGHLLLDGLTAHVGFWKGTMDKIGLEADMVRVGAYKSAVETYTRTSMSGEFRESLDALLDDVFGQYVSDLATGRGLSNDVIRACIDQGPYSADGARAASLVDGLRYRTEIIDALGMTEKEVIGLDRYVDAVGRGRGTRIALIVIEGAITPGRSSDLPFAEPTAGAESVVDALRAAREDERLKGVLLRVSSPGGSAMASDVIWDEVRRTAEIKPVVVSMGDVAASGGYYVAMPATRILAEATTITGSIGVYAGKLVAGDLYDKMDYHVEVLTRGSRADLFSETRPFTDDERTTLQRMLWDFYWNSFVTKAAQGRKLPPERVDALGGGRVWSGLRAQEVGLVDTLGGIWEAQAELRALLGLPHDADVALVPVPRPKPLVAKVAEFLLAGGSGERFVSHLSESSGIPAEPGLFTRIPFRLTIE